MNRRPIRAELEEIAGGHVVLRVEFAPSILDRLRGRAPMRGTFFEPVRGVWYELEPDQRQCPRELAEWLDRAIVAAGLAADVLDQFGTKLAPAADIREARAT